MRQPFEIKDQGSSDLCFGCAVSSAAEELLGEPCDEAYSYAAGRAASGKPISSRGLRPFDALWGAIRYGVLPKSKSPYSLASHSRDFLANIDNWESCAKDVAHPFGSLRKLGGFEDVLARADSESIVVGIYWQPEWRGSIMGEVSEFSTWEPHEMRVLGSVDGMIALQDSKGTGSGDSGVWLMTSFAAKAMYHAYSLRAKRESRTSALLHTALRYGR